MELICSVLLVVCSMSALMLLMEASTFELLFTRRSAIIVKLFMNGFDFDNVDCASLITVDTVVAAKIIIT